MLSTNLQREKTDVWTLSNYQSVLLDMMVACAYKNSETLFFECFRECFFHTFCIHAEFILHITVKIILKSGVETQQIQDRALVGGSGVLSPPNGKRF
jgi:hypothetical protein